MKRTQTDRTKGTSQTPSTHKTASTSKRAMARASRTRHSRHEASSCRQPVHSVTVFEGHGHNMWDSWTDRITVTRSSRRHFSVSAQKYCADPKRSDHSRWETWNHEEQVTTIDRLITAVLFATEYLSVELDAAFVVKALATIDWLSAAVLATEWSVEFPPLPKGGELRQQRALRGLGKVSVWVDWHYDLHEVRMPYERWLRLLNGESLTLRTTEYADGERASAYWQFSNSELSVEYHGGGQHWRGTLSALDELKGPMVRGVDLAKMALCGAGPLPGKRNENRKRAK